MSASPSAPQSGDLDTLPQEPMNSEGLLIWGLLDQERKSGEVCSVLGHEAQIPDTARQEALGRSWWGLRGWGHGQGNRLFLCSLSYEGRSRERKIPSRRLLGPEPARRKGEGTMMNADFYPHQASSTVRRKPVAE